MKVISCDGQEFDVDQDIIKQSKLLKYYFEGNEFCWMIIYLFIFILLECSEDIDEPITLPHIQGSIMKAVRWFWIIIYNKLFLFFS